MRRDAKGPRLYLRPERRNDAGAVTHKSEWIIRDGSRQVRTRCGPADRQGAEEALAAYIVGKHQPSRDARDPRHVPVADVIAIYLADRAGRTADASAVAARAERLLEFFGDMTLAQITGQTCRIYADRRGKRASARRELEDLRAAIRHHHREGLATAETKVVLPTKSRPRERWLTRSEAARLIWAAWRMKEVQRGRRTQRYVARHIARFILVALYTGSRAGAVCEAETRPSGRRAYVDVGAGVLHRGAPQRVETSKRRPPAALPHRLLAHIRRWIEKGLCVRHVVEWRGRPVRRVTKGFRNVVEAAGLEVSGPLKVTPHTLRHTAATWGMQAGVDVWRLAQYLGMTVEVLIENYGHWHPEFGREAAEAIARRVA